MRLLWSPSKEDLLSLISEARESVDLAVAYISKTTASELVSALPDGVHLRILTRCSGRDFFSGIASVDMFEFLASHSQLRAMPNLHAKLYIVDGQTAILGSGNLTRAGLGGDGKHNEEAGLFVDDPSLIREMCGRWNEWWQQAAPVDDQFVDELLKIAAQLPRTPQADERIEQAISQLAQGIARGEARRPLFDFSFPAKKTFLNCSDGHPKDIPKNLFDRVIVEQLTEISDMEVLCPDGSRRPGSIRSYDHWGDLYYRIRVGCGNPCPIRGLRIGQRLHVEVSRGNGTVRIDLHLEEGS